MNKFVIALCALCTASLAHSVDGYKDVKFGASKDDLLAANICDFSLDAEQAKLPAVEYYSCHDAHLGPYSFLAMATFINGRFMRLVFFKEIYFDNYVGHSDLRSISGIYDSEQKVSKEYLNSVLSEINQGLVSKYGEPNDRTDEGKRRQIGYKITMHYEDSTVQFYSLTGDITGGEVSAVLIGVMYMHPRFGEIFNKPELLLLGSRSLADDL